jgi:hypothetical protein
MIGRGYIVETELANGAYGYCAFFIERQHAEEWDNNHALMAGLAHTDVTPKTRIVPAYRIDHDQTTHIHHLQ